jgi:hypothetical protein
MGAALGAAAGDTGVVDAGALEGVAELGGAALGGAAFGVAALGTDALGADALAAGGLGPDGLGPGEPGTALGCGVGGVVCAADVSATLRIVAARPRPSFLIGGESITGAALRAFLGQRNRGPVLLGGKIEDLAFPLRQTTIDATAAQRPRLTKIGELTCAMHSC